ncbi:peptidyl-prolyl cis-trans isomerase NIMA-interacting 1-like protein [Conidiobolus coronatus NRRL 28638]|uniref:Peptidyl-prolyl cis-trans isomerase n=1 Tax=Conidiobolus coronatus (strain ATCC 28846 / CBS 209.66 / NRRL 28638) TaxID=796925 RepID=A0A137P8W4_CONC2|nr:peptidyl-prolyl cis-trans isomerase NIMA-interacting 1-like protein [Conidiobolus coronatus NRRL 28638]|eukprot:KXN71440.1 peptidyl-prolyl cis-trans isomerase NIMA-interacting 1-like protein [Conidiobolus coronatus NRRL 28638]
MLYLSDLPPGWEQRHSQSHNKPYYFNSRTGESVWEKPRLDSSNSGLLGARHLLVKHNQSRRPSSWREPTITRTPEEALEIIENYRGQIVSGQVNFEQLAEQFSDCSSAKRGGDLGTFLPGQMQAAFENATKQLRVGELSQPVYSDSGIHLILRTL